MTIGIETQRPECRTIQKQWTTTNGTEGAAHLPSQEMKHGPVFVERAPDWLRWGGAVFLVLIAVLLAVAGGLESSWGLHLGAVFFLGMGLWWCFLARIAAAVSEEQIKLSGPLWKRTVRRGDLHDVSVDTDSGMNTGLVNWPVTRRERGSLVRMNMGGSAVVTFSENSGRSYQFVLAERRSAERMARAITD